MSFSPRTFAGLADDLPFQPIDPYEQRWAQLTWRALLLAVLVFAAYALTINGGWLWQDEAQVLDDLRLRSRSGIVEIWSSPFADASATPMTQTLWWLEHQVGPKIDAGGRTVVDDSPEGDAARSVMLHRCVGLALHAWTCIALWLALRRLNVSAAWLIAAVIAMHPTLIAVVAWPSRQGQVLGAALAASALLAMLRATYVEPPIEVPDDVNAAPLPDEPEDQRWLTWTAFWLCAIAAPFADPRAAIALAVLIPAVRWMRDRRTDGVLWIASGVVALLAVVVATLQARSSSADVEAIQGLLPRSVEALVAVPASVVHAFVPWQVPLVSDRSQWDGGHVAVAAVFGVAAIVLLAGFAAFVARRPREAVVCVAALAGVWAVEALRILEPRADLAVADLIVLPAVAIVCALAVASVAALLQERLRPLDERMVRWSLGFALVGGLAALTASGARAFGDEEAFWAAAVARSPRSTVTREQFAAYLLSRSQADRALEQLDAVQEDHRDVAWLLARGRTLEALHRTDAALGDFAAAYQAAPDRPDVVIAMAEAKRTAGQPNAAIYLYQQFLQRHPNDASIHNNLGLAYAYAGEADQAIASYEGAIRLDPSYVAARINLANLLFEQGRFDESSAQLKKATEIDPRNFVAFMTSGSMLYRLHQHRAAEQMFRVAASIDPDSADAFDRLGITLAAQGGDRMREAVWSFTRAARLKPDDLEIAQHLRDAQAQATAPTTQR